MKSFNKYLFLFVAIAFSSCYEDFENNVDTQIDDPVKYVTNTLLSGLVTDHNGLTLNTGLSGSFGNDNTSNESFPFFNFKGVQIDKFNEVITLDINGTSHEYIVPTIENQINYSHRAIFTDRSITSITADISKEIDNTLSISTNTNSFQSNGSQYSGEVVIHHHTIDVDNKWHLATLPGNNTAIGSEGLPLYLKFEQVEYIAFKSQNDEILDISMDQVQAEWLTNINDLEVWHYDNMINKWRFIPTENNVFTLNQNGYYATAQSEYYVYASGYLYEDGLAIANTELQITEDNKLLSTVRTASNGQWVAIVPAHSQVAVTVINDCDEVASVIFETIDEDIETDPINLEWTASTVYNLTGQIKSCNDANVQTSYLEIITAEGISIYYVDNTTFNINIISCSDHITVRSVNEDGTESGAQLQWELDDATLNLRSIYACNDTQEEYLSLRIDGGYSQYYGGQSFYENDRTIIDFSNMANGDLDLKIWFTGDETGNYTDDALNIEFDDRFYNNRGFQLDCASSSEGCGFDEFEISQYQETDKWIRGYFKGRFWIKSYNPLTAGYKDVEGDFQVRRDF